MEAARHAGPEELLDVARRRLADRYDGASLSFGYGTWESPAARQLPLSGALRPELSAAQLAEVRAGEVVVAGEETGTRLVLVPLRRDHEVHGWLQADLGRGPPIDAGDRELCLGVGLLLGAALERSDRTADTAVVDSFIREVALSLDLTTVVDRIASRVHEVTEQPVVLWLLDGERSRATARAGETVVRLGSERLLGPDFLGPPENPPDGYREDREVVELALGSRRVAFLELGPWGGDPPAPERLRLVRRMAPFAAAALENAQLHQEVRRLSLTDSLVQLPNRRHLGLFLERELAAAARGRALTLVMYDLDHFKEYNDERGHQAGDAALVRFADILRAETRAMNLAARYGGEEFAVVLSGADLEGGRVHAERVRSRVAATFAGALTVSAGVAQWRPGMATAEPLVAAADRALYRAKGEGRNRVCVADG